MSALLKASNLNQDYQLIDNPDLSIQDRLKDYYEDQGLYDKLFDQRDLKLEGTVIEHFVNTINNLINKQAKVLFVSDYDCDGVTSLTIMMRLFEHLGLHANYYIPSRIKEGYGINCGIVEMAHRNHFDAIITLDNGIVAVEPIALANKYGIEVDIIDHHQYQELPKANAIIHPNMLDPYYEGLCTGGLTYLISKQFYEDDYSAILAMVATLADVCKVYKANRNILINGLERLNTYQGKPLPIHHLLKKQKAYSFTDISFQLVPKINAISRMDHLANVNMLAKYMLDVNDDNLDTAKQIEFINNERKRISRESADKISKNIALNENIMVVYDESLVEGLCGLIATNLVKRFNKPCLVFTKGEDCIVKGSGRSVEGFDLYACLNQFKDLFTSFGGHQKAVGLSMSQDNFDVFKKKIKSCPFKLTHCKKKCIVVHDEELKVDNFKFLNSLEPFGEGFAEPLFYIEHPKIKYKFLIKNLYPKFIFENGAEAISFDKTNFVDNIEGMVGHIEVQTFGHKTNVDINIDQIVIKE